MAASDLVDAEGVYVSLDGMPILRDVDVRVAPGEAVALLGGNGSGKSTLIRTLLGLIPHQEGRISLLGEPLAQFHDWRRVGYVPQTSAINVANATVREIVSSGRLAHRHPFRWATAEDRAAMADALEQVGLAGRAQWPFAALSGGQKQRVLIARALYRRPGLLLLDEATSHLDVEREAQVNAAIARATVTRIVIAHRPETIRACDRVIVLKAGRVAFDRTVRRSLAIRAERALPAGAPA